MSELKTQREATILEEEQVKDIANAEIEKIYKEMGWKRERPLSQGDVRAVIEAWEKLKEITTPESK